MMNKGVLLKFRIIPCPASDGTVPPHQFVDAEHVNINDGVLYLLKGDGELVAAFAAGTWFGCIASPTSPDKEGR